VLIEEKVMYRFQIIDESLITATNLESPAGRLVMAMMTESPRDLIELAKENTLDDAISTCTRAALHLDVPDHQKLMVLAACFGFLQLHTPNVDVSRIAQVLRFTNAIRKDLGMYVPASQVFDDISIPNNILVRICGRLQFRLAFELADFLDLDKQQIVTEWVCLCARRNAANPEVARTAITRKMEANFNTRAVLAALNKLGFSELAAQVAAAETSRARTVPFYIATGRWMDAIAAASSASDSALLLSVIRRGLVEGAADFSSIIVAHPMAVATVSMYASCWTDSPPPSLIARLLEKIEGSNVRIALDRFLADHNPEWISEAAVKQGDNPSGRSRRAVLESVTANMKIVTAAINGRVAKREDVGEPVMVILRKMITERRYAMALQVVEKSGISKTRVMYLAGAIYKERNNWQAFLEIAPDSTAESWPWLAMMALTWGDDRADGAAKAQEVLALTKMKEKDRAKWIGALPVQEFLEGDRRGPLRLAIETKAYAGIFCS
jgi:hypothetical protein